MSETAQPVEEPVEEPTSTEPQYVSDDAVRSHQWQYKLRPDAAPGQIEFGDAVDKEEAKRRLASYLGVAELPEEVEVLDKELSELSPEVVEGVIAESGEEDQPPAEEAAPA